MSFQAMYSDDPVDGTQARQDRLGRDQYAQHVAAIVDRVRDNSRSSVMSLVGPWGSGKSSVLELAKTHLTAPGRTPNWIVTEFTPWLYQDLEAMQLGFFSALRGALPKSERWNDTRKNLGALGSKVTSLAKALTVIGVDASTAVEWLTETVQGDVSAEATKRKVSAALDGMADPIMVVIDDVDRLTPPELLLVLKLVRLVGRLPNVYYLLCFDEKTLLDVLTQTDLATDPARARDYLEKIVQVRLDIPALRSHQAQRLLNETLDQVLTRHEITLDRVDQRRINMAYNEYLQTRLRTPRSINRFVAQFDAFYGVIQGEVNFVDFFLLTWIRTSEPGVYSLLMQERSALTSTGNDYVWSLNRQRPTAVETAQKWKGRIGGAGVAADHVDHVYAVLTMMFPATTGIDHPSSRAQAISDPDYFDRYFTFGVPSEDIADSVFDAALQELAGGTITPAVQQLRRILVEDSARIIRKVERRAAVPGFPAEAMITELATAYKLLPPEPDSIFPAGSGLHYLAARLLRPMSGSRVDGIVRSLGATDEVLRFAGLIAENLNAEQGVAANSLDAATAARSAVLDMIKYRLSPTFATTPSDLNELQRMLFWTWLTLDMETLGQWCQNQVSEARWEAKDAVAMFVPVSHVMGTSGDSDRLDSLNIEAVISLYGWDFFAGTRRSGLGCRTRASGATNIAPELG